MVKNSVLRSYRRLLIILGLIECVFPAIALYTLSNLLTLATTLKRDPAFVHFGLWFFGFALAIAVLQILVGVAGLDMRLGKTKTRLLMVLGLILTILTIPALLLFIVSPIYSLEILE